ncbi:protein shisa-4 [Magallana gigas]|uniref:protein shisa-4 n=1 Tax=Magallana gigas TaxID=29159 RepID=UPI003340E8D8
MAFTELFHLLPCLVLFAFFQGVDCAYRYRYYSYYSYYYSYYSISAGVISAIVLAIGAAVTVTVITIICCCRAAQRRNQLGGVVYTNGGQQSIITTANTVPGMYPAQPYPGQYNAGVPYAPTGLYTAPGQQFTYPPPGQPYANAPPPGQQYNNPLPSYDETTGNKTPMQ